MAACVACAILIYMPIAWWAKLPLIASLIATAWFHVRKDALLRSPNSWQSLTLDASGKWQATNVSGRTYDIAILPWSVATSIAIILCFRVEGRSLPSSIVLLPDSLGADEHRHLRVWLRWAYRRSEAMDDAS